MTRLGAWQAAYTQAGDIRKRPRGVNCAQGSRDATVIVTGQIGLNRLSYLGPGEHRISKADAELLSEWRREQEATVSGSTRPHRASPPGGRIRRTERAAREREVDRGRREV